MIVLKQKAGLHYGLPPPSPPQPPSPWSSILRGDDRRPRRHGRRVACGVRVTQLRDKVIAKVRFHAGRARCRASIPLRSFLLAVFLSLLTQLGAILAELFVLSTKIRQMAIINFRIERLDSGAGAPADDEDTTRSCKRYRDTTTIEAGFIAIFMASTIGDLFPAKGTSSREYREFTIDRALGIVSVQQEITREHGEVLFNQRRK
ncbi:hypothetical protein ALC57_06350 [Trachymyrmex cornetzi]|uniref:Uncharacterized protein n=1 Tax=Trachymyrmex cornetzi TaxID=471704 RepID=A0A151J8R4_9HYME|nr:hypothetical protein ALC57_06350 [Trachymyrmex cornetzi]